MLGLLLLLLLRRQRRLAAGLADKGDGEEAEVARAEAEEEGALLPARQQLLRLPPAQEPMEEARVVAEPLAAERADGVLRGNPPVGRL